jgi:carboxymethylenebutenolidase
MTDVQTESIAYPADGLAGMGYLARPADDAAHPGVIVIQEWWGVDEHIRDVARRLANEGYVALAPDLYHGESASEPDEARKLAMHMNREQAMKDLLGAVAHLEAMPQVAPRRFGCIGFCMGGSLTLALAAASPKILAAAAFYAGMQPPAEHLAKIEAEVFAAFGADDGGIPLENVRKFEDALREHGRTAEVKVYEGAPHSFFNDTRPSYRADAARDAWGRSLALFGRVLR